MSETAYLRSRAKWVNGRREFCANNNSRTVCALPNFTRACRRASWGDIPRATLSAVSSVRKDSISCCNSASRRLRRRKLNQLIAHLPLRLSPARWRASFGASGWSRARAVCGLPPSIGRTLPCDCFRSHPSEKKPTSGLRAYAARD